MLRVKHMPRVRRAIGLSKAITIGLSVTMLTTATSPLPNVPTATWKPIGFLVSQGEIRRYGLTGVWHSTVDLADGRFEMRSDLGAYRIADVYDGRTRWAIDPSGGNHPLDSDFAVAMTRTEAWLARFGWLQSRHGGAALSPRQKKYADGKAYLVQTATPPGGRPVILWFDASTGDLKKSERRIWYTTVTTLYDDYRKVGEHRLPFSIDDGDQVIRISDYTFVQDRSHRFLRPPQPDDVSVPAAGTTVAAPIFPQLVIEASINGSAPMGFVFDTGGHSILTPGAAEALGLHLYGEGKSGGSGAGTVSRRDASVNTLKIGDAVLRNQHFYVLDLGYASMEQGAKPPLAGILGLEVAERFIVRINYRAGTLTLLPRGSQVTCGGSWQTIRFTDDMPTVKGAVDGIPASFTVDTGSNGSLQVYDHWAREHGLTEKYRRGLEMFSHGTGGVSRNWLSYGSSFRLGGVTIPRPMVRISDDKAGVAMSISEAGNLGTDLLANYTITLDYARSRACFEYVPGYVPLPPSRSGLQAMKTGPDAFAVHLVIDGSPAAQAGLQKGDRIVAVEGRPAQQLSAGDFAQILTQPEGTRVKVDYERDNSVRRHTVIVLRELLRAH